MGRSGRSQNKEKLSRKEKLEMRKDSEKLHEQLKTVSRWNCDKHLYNCCLLDSTADPRCHRIPHYGLRVHEDPPNSYSSRFRRRLSLTINHFDFLSAQGPFHDWKMMFHPELIFFINYYSTFVKLRNLKVKVSCTRIIQWTWGGSARTKWNVHTSLSL